MSCDSLGVFQLSLPFNYDFNFLCFLTLPVLFLLFSILSVLFPSSLSLSLSLFYDAVTSI